MATSVTQYGITWAFNANYNTGQFVNGDYWVVGPVVINSITPACTVVAGRTLNGSMIDPAMANIQGYDSSISAFLPYSDSVNVGKTMPLTVRAGHSLISAKGNSTITNVKYASSDAAVLTVLAAVPASGSFRPTYYYSGYAANVTGNKTVLYNWSQVAANLGKLPSSVNIGSLNLTSPVTTPGSNSEQYSAGCGSYTNWTGALSDFLPQIQRVWLDHYPDYEHEYLAATNNNCTYGSNSANKLNWATLLTLMYNQLVSLTGWSSTDVQNLMIYFIQKGIDWAGAIHNQPARYNGWWPNGGHCQGRKWPVMFAALMCGDPENILPLIKAKSGDYITASYSSPTKVLPSSLWPADGVYFAEDAQTFIVSASDVAVSHTGNYNASASTGYVSGDIGVPEWGSTHTAYPPNDDKWYNSDYRQPEESQMYRAFAIAARVLGQQANWNHNAFFYYTDRFVEINALCPSPNQNVWWPHETVIARNMWPNYWLSIRSAYPYWTRNTPTAIAGFTNFANEGTAFNTSGDAAYGLGSVTISQSAAGTVSFTMSASAQAIAPAIPTGLTASFTMSVSGQAIVNIFFTGGTASFSMSATINSENIITLVGPVVSGLSHLEGQTVAILANGIVLPNQVVAGGTITLPFGTTGTITVGLPFRYKLEPMRPDISGRGGISQGSIVSVKEMGISFLNTMNTEYGVSDTALFDIDWQNPQWENKSTIAGLFTGLVSVSVDGGFSAENNLIISDDSPLPCTVRALIPREDITGR